jgi:gliding motility-associated-like protein
MLLTLPLSQAFAQLTVTITYNGEVVNPVQGCQGSTTVLSSEVENGSGDYTYNWTCNPVTASFIPSDDVALFTTTTPANTYTVTLDVEDNISGLTASNSITVVISPKPLSNITANGATTFCQGGSVQLEETNNQVGVTYQWLKEGVVISGATNDTYNASSSGSYRVRVIYESTGCNERSNAILVTVNPLPSATATNDGPACYNGTINFTSGPDGMVSYTWTSNSVTPFNSTDQNPSLTGVTPNNSGNYTVTVKDGNGCEGSAVTTVLVYADMNGGTVASDQSICYNGDPATFTNEASPSGGDGSWTYFWQSKVGLGAWTNIDGATGLTYDVPAGLTTTTQYRRGATNGCGTVYSNTITVTVYAQMNGGQISPDQTICYNGDPDIFNDDTSPSGGTGAWSYKWYSKVGINDWTEITGATGLTYNAPAGLTQTTMYHRVAQNNCGIVTSNDLTVTVNDAISGGVIGSSQSVCYGGDPDAFTNETSPSGGAGAWTYTWQSKVGLGSWNDIGSGLTYDIPAGITQTTQYRRKAENACGIAYSNELTVTVYPQMNGGEIEGDQSQCYNSDPSEITNKTSPSGGNGPWTYTWEYQSNCAGGWNTVGGASGLTYDPPANQIETRCYRRVSTNSCGIVYSNTVTKTIYADINGGTVTADQTLCYGADPDAFQSTSAPSGGNGSWNYQWQSKVGSGSWDDIPGATALTYDVPAGITQTTQYRRSATNECGTGYSNVITVTVSDAVNGGQISTPDGVCYNGDPDPFTDVVSPTGGAGAWIYDWQYNEGGPWLSLGVNSLTYDIPAGQTTTRTYRRVATNDCATGYSNVVTITVYADMNGGTIASNQTLCNNSDPMPLTSTTNPSGGNGTWTYSWEYQTNCAGGWTTIAGANGLEYDPPAGQTETRCYRRVATNDCGTVYSNTITITITPEILGNTISADQTICSGSAPAQLTGTIPTGGDGSYAYRWQISTTAPTGPFANITPFVTTQNYSPAALTQTTWYRRLVTSSSCASMSNVLEITVNQPIDNNTISTDQTICYNTAPSLLTGTSPTGGNGTYTYQWQSSTDGAAGPFSDMGGATNATYQPGNLTQDTWFRRIVISPPCSDNISTPIKITVNPEITLIFSTTSPLCVGDDSGTATVTPSGGTPPFTYSWATTPVQTNPTATALVAGTYSVAVTDSKLCSATGNATVTDPTPITFNPAVITDVTGCYGNSNGAIEISVTGGSSPYVYTLYNAGVVVSSQTQPLGTPAVFGSLAYSDQYEVRVTDANNCGPESSGLLTVNQPTQVAFTYTTKDLNCYGDHSGEIHFSPTGGTAPYQYSINNGFTWGNSPDITGLTAGTYHLKVRDANLCTTVRQTVVINQPLQLVPVVANISQVTTCYGDNTGSITVTMSGGTPPYEFSINGGTTWQPSGTFDNLYAGTYTITARDASGCTKNIGPNTIDQPDEIDILLVDVTDVTGCWYNTNGEIFIWANGGTGTLEYSIDGGLTWQEDPLFENLGVNTYSVAVRDANGCVVSHGNVTVNGPTPITITSLDVDDVTCFGGANGKIDATATGGTAPLQYSINGTNYFGSGLFEFLTAKTYTLYVRDANLCVLTQEVEVKQPAALQFTTEQAKDITCHGLTDGEITLVATGGTGSLSYRIRDIDPFTNTTGIFTGLPAATDYHAAVRDANGCVHSSANTLTIKEPDEITVTSTSFTNLQCFNDNTGSITIVATGGTLPRVYNLYDNTLALVASNDNGHFTAVPAGTYTVEITDANNCGPVPAGTFTLTEPTQLQITGQSSTNITCHDANDGTITITASGGTGSITYNLRDGSGTLIVSQVDNGVFAGLAEGSYNVQVFDANGCGPVPAGPFTIVNPEALTITQEVVSPISCNGTDDGSITITVSGAVNPVTYTLYNSVPAIVTSNGTGQFTGLTDDIYTVEVADASGCPSVKSNPLEVIRPTTLKIESSTVTNISCNGQTDGVIEVVASGGTPPYTYVLYDDSSNPIKTQVADGKFTGLVAGNYKVSVDDGNTCGAKYTDVLSVVEPTILSFTFTKKDIGCNGAGNGEINITAAGGTPPYEYSFDGGTTFGNDNEKTNLSGGDYTLVVRDSRGCSQTQTTTITEAPEMVLTLTGFDLSCNGKVPADGRIVAVATGGTSSGIQPKYFRIDGSSSWTTSGVFNNVSVGLHTIDVVDANSCIVSETITIGEPQPIVINSVTSTNPTCNTFGTITVSASGGTGTLTYTLNPGGATNTTGVFNGLGDGNYTVDVSDANSCGPVTTNVISITSPSAISIDNISVTHVTGCYGGNNGSIAITASGGVGTLQYSIDGGANYFTTNTFNGLTGGNYVVVVNDDANCPQSQPVSVNQPAAITITNVFRTQVTSPTSNDGAIVVLAEGGTGTLTYTLQPTGTVNTTGEFYSLAMGTYWVVVTDENGCSESTDPISLSAIEPKLTPTHITCNGDNNGQISLTITGGTAPYTISWTGPSGPITAFDGLYVITDLGPGLYTVNVVDNEGITGTSFVEIIEPAAVGTQTLISNSPNCSGDSDGSILVEGSGGTTPYQYTLYDAAMNQLSQNATGVFSNLATGNYNIKIVDSHGCSFNTGVTINPTAPIAITNTSVVHPSSSTINDGQIIITASGGTGLLTYTLLPAGVSNTSGSFSGLATGTYTIRVEDVNGCFIVSDNIVLSGMTIQLDQVMVSCHGLSDGKIIVTVNNAHIPPSPITVVTRVLDNVVMPGTENLAAGEYNVAVTDGAGKTVSQNITLTEPEVLTATISFTNPLCNGDTTGTVTAIGSGGTPPYIFTLRDAALFDTIASNNTGVFDNHRIPAGSYHVTLKDVNGCEAITTDVTLVDPSPIALSIDQVVHPSTGATADGSIRVSASGGTGVYTYTLQPGGISNTSGLFDNLTAGTYTVEAKDENGCSKESDNIILSGMTLSLTAEMVKCHGGTDGEIIVTVNDAIIPPVPITVVTRLSDGATMPSTTNLAAGNYMVTVTDGAGKIVSQNISITEPDTLQVTLISTLNPTCWNTATGKVTFGVDGGTPGYNVTWTNNLGIGGGSPDTVAIGVMAGKYKFTIHDSNGCMFEHADSIELTNPDRIVVTNLTQFNPTCYGEPIGLINATATGGTGDLTYRLIQVGVDTTDRTDGVFEHLMAGTYTLDVYDANACFAVFDEPMRIVLTQPSPIVVSLLSPEDTLDCPNVPEGNVWIQVDGGQPDYTFLWSNGSRTPNLQNVVVGKYTVTITDALNCKVSKDFNVNGPDMLELFTTIDTAYCKVRSDGLDIGRIEIDSIHGGTGTKNELEYTWDYKNVTGTILGNVSAGKYTVSVIDKNKCNYTETFEVPANPHFNFNAFAGVHDTVCYNTNDTLRALVQGGDKDLTFTFKWWEFPNVDRNTTPLHETQTPDTTFRVTLTGSKTYLLRVYNNKQKTSDPICLDSSIVEKSVYPEIGIYVPSYISAVKDTIISILAGQDYNMDVITKSVEYETTFEWKPDIMFVPSNSWNSTLVYNDEIKTRIPDSRKKILKDPLSKRDAEFILVDVIARTEVGCVDSIRLYTKIVDKLYYSNVFSPNGDGLNDRWYVPKDYLFPDLEVEIFNRWGSPIWSAKGDKARDGWDGRTNNGKELPIGTYYYVIKYNTQASGWKPITGSVTIVK